MLRFVSISAVLLGLLMFSLSVLPKTQVQAKSLQQVATATRTHTPTPTRTLTPTATLPICTPVDQTIFTLPYEKNGTGTFCVRTHPAINLSVVFMESWNLQSLTINGVNYTNVFVPRGSLPPAVRGMWYVRYVSAVPWGSFRINASPTP